MTRSGPLPAQNGFIIFACGRIRCGQKLVTGKVVNGKVSLPDGEFEEGFSVAVMASSANEPVVLTPAEEQLLLESLNQIRSGKYVDGEDLVRRLRSHGR